MKKKALNMYELRWEYVRLSKEYRADYDNYRKNLDELKKQRGSYFIPDGFERKYSQFFAEKYGIEHPLDYNLSYLESFEPSPKILKEYLKKYGITKTLGKGRKSVITKSLSYWAGGARCLDDESAFVLHNNKVNPIINEGLRQKNSIKILVDLDVPLATIKKEIERIITKWQKLRGRVVRQEPYKRRCDDYERYLIVYLLLDKGCHINKVAKIFYEGDAKRDMNYARRKVRRDYDRAQKLIEGGCRQIR